MTRAVITDPLTLELGAMAAIGRALADLPDADARARVLRWAFERFAPDAAIVTNASAAGAAAPTRAPEDDQTLVVDSLAELFDEAPPQREAARQGQPVDTLVKGFVTDFQRLVVEWQGA